MGLRGFLREVWDCARVWGLSPEYAAWVLEKDRAAIDLRPKPKERPEVEVRWLRDGEPVSSVDFHKPLEPGQHMGRYAAENTGRRAIVGLVVRAPRGMLLARDYRDRDWHEELRYGLLEVGQSVSFVAKASSDIAGTFGGLLRAEEEPEPEWETYG